MSKKINNVLESLDLGPGSDDATMLKQNTTKLKKVLVDELKKSKAHANVFIGGSYAKETMIKKNVYDIDIFVRFESKNFPKDIKKLYQITIRLAKSLEAKHLTVHGSRDYYRIEVGNRMIYEIIPAISINSPENAENVMDLSYFHVAYMKKHLNKKMKREMQIAKSFCTAQGVYGAESYIQGFSGYALECLISYYKSFEKMLRELSKKSSKIFIDPEKHYKNKSEAFTQMNESKLQSPVIIVDPTWKKRNVLASLSFETFLRFQEVAREFLRKPGKEFFVKKEHSKEEIEEIARDAKAEFVILKLTTTKQEGDIAGTKMKKAMRFIIKEVEEKFTVIKTEFFYSAGQESKIYFVAKSKRAITLSGPPIKMPNHVKAFKKEHKRCFVKNGKVYAIEPVNETLKGFIKNNLVNSLELKSMAISKLEVN